MKLFGRLLLVFALLFAQAAGVAHQVWHDAAPAVAHSDEAAGQGKAPQKNLLCDFHTALSAVLGAVNGASQAPLAAVQSAVAFVAADASADGLSGPTPRSRAPPTLL